MSNTTALFEMLPFRTDGEARSEEVRRRMGGISARSPRAIGPGRDMYHGPHRPPYGLRRPIGGYGPVAAQAGIAPDYTQAPATGAAPSEQIRWVQFALNQIMNAGLPTDGIASPDFRAALRDFQGRNGLPVSGFVGPDTVAALRRASESISGAEVFGEIFEVGPAGINAATMAWAGRVRDLIDREMNRQNPQAFVHSRVPSDVTTEKGLYRITWNAAVGLPSMYNGIALQAEGGLRGRLMSHALKARQLGFTLDQHQFRVLKKPDLSDEQLRALEWVINDRYLNDRPRIVTNERRELELPEPEAL